MKIINKQYPVGQGGLHLGKICTNVGNENNLYAYIYDCGAINKKDILYKQIDNLIKDLNSQEHGMSDGICGLRRLCIFISHLHTDHVNGLVYLKQKLNENNISVPKDKTKEKIELYLPYMEDIEKKIIICSYDENDMLSFEDYKKLIINPNDFFDNYFKVIYVYDKGKCKEKENPDGTYIINHEETIENVHLCWLLKTFYNQVEPKDMSDIDFLKNIEYEDITKDYIKELRKKYKKIFREMDMNLSSLCLYSGPTRNKSNHSYLHTGDVNLTKIDIQDKIRKHFEECKDNIKTIQIPHHGSKNNSSLDIFRKIFPNYKQLFVTKQTQPNKHQQPEYSQEYEDLGTEIKQITEDNGSVYITILLCNYYKDLNCYI